MASEIKIQQEIFKKAWNEMPETRYCLYHVPNEANRSVIEQQQQKSSGLIPGIQDLHLLWDGMTYRFELKDAETFAEAVKKVDPAQKVVHAAHYKQKALTYLFFRPEDCLQLIREIISDSASLNNYNAFISPFCYGNLQQLEKEYYLWLERQRDQRRRRKHALGK